MDTYSKNNEKKQKIMSKLKKTIILAFVFIVVSIGFGLVYNDMVSLDNHKYYRQAVNFYVDEDYQNAYFNFSKIKKISPLYQAAVFKQGICAEKLADYPIAIKKYNLLIKKYQKSIFIPKARYRLAKSYFNNKQFEEAKEEFTYIQRHSPVEDYVIASNYYLGLIEKSKNPELAKKYFVDYISLSPKGTFALASAEELRELNSKLTLYQNLIVGEVYYQNKKYNSAVKFLEKAEFKKAWTYLGVSYSKIGQRKKAVIVLDTGIKKYSRTVSSELLYDALAFYAESFGQDQKKGWFYLSKLVQANKSAGEDYVLYKLAKYLPEPQNLNLYSKVAYKYPKSDYASESLWNLFWHAYQSNKYEVAKKIGDEHLKRYSDAVANPRMLYWMAKLALSHDKTTEANGYLNKILTLYPDDYYAFRADSALKGVNNGWGTKSYHQLDDRNFNIEFPIKYSNLDIKDLKLINTLLELGDYDICTEVNFDNKFVESWFEYKRGHRATSTLLARSAIQDLDVKPPFSDDAYKLAYPIHWATAINDNSTALKLDPYLIISLIREESYFNPKSVSKSNAIGLMQLMPSTASYIASKYSLPQPTIATLKNPEKNIRLGSNYFRYVKSSLGGNDLLAVAAYNGGPNAVKSWQGKIKHNDLDEFVENIPYSETKTYVKKVYRSYWNYLNIYNY